jgi:hypothetical protein
VGDNRSADQNRAYLGPDVSEDRRARDILTRYPVNARGEARDRPRWFDQPGDRLTDAAAGDRQDSQPGYDRSPSFCRSALRSCSALATAIMIRVCSRPESVPRSMLPSASADRTTTSASRASTSRRTSSQPGTFTWRTPAGRTYTTGPAEY